MGGKWGLFPFLLAAAACSSEPSQATIWVSSMAALTIGPDSSRLNMVSAGGCIDAFAGIYNPIPQGSFSLAGTLTRLTTGPIPWITHAIIKGARGNDKMTITVIDWPDVDTLGPFTIRPGSAPGWEDCPPPPGP